MVLHIFAHNFLNIQCIFNLQKVLESPKSQLSKTFCRLKITKGLNIKKVMSKNDFQDHFETSFNTFDIHGITAHVVGVEHTRLFTHNFLNIQPTFNP